MLTTSIVLIAIIVALAREIAAPAAVLLAGLIVLVLAGIISVEQAFAGLASPATLSIAGLFIVARALRDHGGIDQTLTRMLGDGTASVRGVLARFIPPVMLLSGLTNNTPIVVVGAPVLRSWAEEHAIAASKLLMPLSFAAILGGMLTLIGTAPNLVVSSMLADAGHPPLGFFEITSVGLPIAVVAGIITIAYAPRALPDRRSPHQQIASRDRDYTMRVTVIDGGPLENTTIHDAGLRDLPGGYIAGVMSQPDTTIQPATPAFRLSGGDELVLVGNAGVVADLLERPGLRESEHAHTSMLDMDDTRLTECVVSASSQLVGRTLKQTAFRGSYGAAVIAIHRAGTRLDGKLGTIPLQAGDSLLLLCDPSFTERWNGHRDFAAVIAHRHPTSPAPTWKRHLTIIVFVTMIAAAASGLLPLLHAIFAACLTLLITRVISFPRAISALDIDLLLIVSAAIGLGTAITASGLPQAAIQFAAITADTPPILAVISLAIATLLLTELITNVAAAALMLPIALQTATTIGIDPATAAITIAISASASFLTPLGYQTNTIVYALAGYRYTDYWRLGLPLTATTLTVITVQALH